MKEDEFLSPLAKEKKLLITDESMKDKSEDSNWIGAANYEKVTQTTIDEKFDIFLGLGVASVAHTQKVTEMVIHGEKGTVFGAYKYADLNADSIGDIEEEVGVGLTLLEGLGFELYAKVIGIGAKLSIDTGFYNLFANIDINLLNNVTAAVGVIRELPNNGEVEDSYEIRGNFWAVVAVIYALLTGIEVFVEEQSNMGIDFPINK